ncbi:VWA domain-containing protein [Ornithinimicrobium sp. F0845]|uniref:VWA domain-containing protein n=1 Tax=Ornithinimicrobium sp. F0845 TaxID=2926412 RepID=UPI001FF2812B|nr:VWA domain-containing protein [Ornithinimicrobium sp. F0845]MCK0112969.1 VWA domain-containing protein [Ornithinimicrobium sp. F0845]
MHPQTTQEWQQAIQSQLQGDYAEDLKAAITFNPSVGEGIAQPTEGEVAAEDTVGSNHFALLLDASGSMGETSGTGTRMVEAKETINGFVDSLPEGSTVSLRVYGHEGDNSNAGKQESCASTDTVYEGPADTAELSAQLAAVQPTGWTPLASAITEAEQDIPADATDGIVYVVTDGIETCGGDPVEAAQGLAESGIKPIVNVIGFQAGDADQAALAAIAEAGGGEYTQADSKADLEEYWDAEYSRMMTAWAEWRQAELTRIEESGQANLTEADAVGAALMAGAEAEGDRAMALTEALHADGHLDWSTRGEVWSFFYERKNAMWSYAYGLKNENWSAAYGLKNEAWSQAYGTGNAKWSEYYSKKLGN